MSNPRPFQTPIGKHTEEPDVMTGLPRAGSSNPPSNLQVHRNICPVSELNSASAMPRPISSRKVRKCFQAFPDANIVRVRNEIYSPAESATTGFLAADTPLLCQERTLSPKALTAWRTVTRPSPLRDFRRRCVALMHFPEPIDKAPVLVLALHRTLIIYASRI